MAQIVSWWDEFQKTLAQMEPLPSYSLPTKVKGIKRIKWSVWKKKYWINLYEDQEWDTLESNSLTLVESPLWAQLREYTSTEWTEIEKKMDLAPTLCLRSINIVPFMEGLIYYRSTCPEFRSRDRKVLGTQSYLIHGSVSTHCVLHFNLIKDIFNIHHSRFTHTLEYI